MSDTQLTWAADHSDLNPDWTLDNPKHPYGDQPGETGAYWPKMAFFGLLGGIFAQVADVLFMVKLFNYVINAEESVSWIISLGIVVLVVWLAVGLGRALWKNSKLSIYLTAGIWVLLGLVLAVTRGMAWMILRDASTKAGDIMFACLLFCIYLGAGIDIAHHAKTLSDPRYLILVNSHFSMRRANKKLSRFIPERDRTVTVMERLNQSLKSLTRDVDIANQELDAIEAAMKDRARLLVATHIGDPAATSLYRGEKVPALAS